MRVPKNVKTLLGEVRDLTRQQYDAECGAEMARGRERVEFRKMCEARRAETSVYASEILQWIRDFGEVPEVREILDFGGKIPIFKADFVRPMSPSFPTYTVVELQLDDSTRRPVLNCVEWRNEMRLDEFTLGKFGDMGRAMVFRLHPDFLKQWYEEIKSDKIWKSIESSLK